MDFGYRGLKGLVFPYRKNYKHLKNVSDIMKKGLVWCVLLFSLFVISCAPVSQEELQSQAAAQLQNLSDEELQQLADQSGEGKAVAGQGYSTASLNLRNAAQILRRVNPNEKTWLINNELASRITVRSCETDRDCLPSITRITYTNNNTYCDGAHRLVSVQCDGGRCRSLSNTDCRTTRCAQVRETDCPESSLRPYCDDDGRCIQFRGWNESECFDDRECFNNGNQGYCISGVPCGGANSCCSTY